MASGGGIEIRWHLLHLAPTNDSPIIRQIIFHDCRQHLASQRHPADRFRIGGLLHQRDTVTNGVYPGRIRVLIMASNPGVRRNNKVIAHVAVLLTLIVLVALVVPLRSAINREDSAAIGRLVIMLLSSALAMVFFIKSFTAGRTAVADV